MAYTIGAALAGLVLASLINLFIGIGNLKMSGVDRLIFILQLPVQFILTTVLAGFLSQSSAHSDAYLFALVIAFALVNLLLCFTLIPWHLVMRKACTAGQANRIACLTWFVSTCLLAPVAVYMGYLFAD